eukprot:932386-Prorocentrum_minimum.AAC.5
MVLCAPGDKPPLSISHRMVCSRSEWSRLQVPLVCKQLATTQLKRRDAVAPFCIASHSSRSNTSVRDVVEDTLGNTGILANALSKRRKAFSLWWVRKCSASGEPSGGRCWEDASLSAATASSSLPISSRASPLSHKSPIPEGVVTATAVQLETYVVSHKQYTN